MQRMNRLVSGSGSDFVCRKRKVRQASPSSLIPGIQVQDARIAAAAAYIMAEIMPAITDLFI